MARKYQRRLTGQFTITKGLFGWKIRVQCFKTVSDFTGDDSPDIKVWRKARMEDLVELGIHTHNLMFKNNT